jgi:uncharacterized paraquat-inducible protein A
VPWCEACSRFYNPPSMGASGECPTCGRVIADAAEPPVAPWHFKLLLAAVVLYLGFRAWQGVAWLLDRL